MANRLAGETSPYLLQHADNPVDWYPWGPEALEAARAADKPILLSIGYAACHWCHVMAHESFENDATAKVLNERFVCIKVDREERPDLDAVYMQAIQSLVGRGGWPLTAFLLPDGRPFYGGTYYPPVDTNGMPSFTRVLHSVYDAYVNRREDVMRNAALITQTLRDAAGAASGDAAPDLAVPDEAYSALASAFDPTHGGFNHAPKFPQPLVLGFLLRYHARTGEGEALAMVLHSLDAMAAGGIHDHLGGGFHRYSTDDQWLVPHFEKMLYDNALLASLYVGAYQITREPRYRAVAESTLDYLLREMRDPAGGFYSSQDADSEGVEGTYYVWSKTEVDGLLGRRAASFSRRYGVTQDGNWEGHTILHVASPTTRGPRDLASAKAALLDARAKRVPPATDDKVLTAWNALTIRALAEAAMVLDRDDYRDAAQATAGFVLDELRDDGRLLRVWRQGRAHQPGYLDDYANLINALMTLHEATFGHRWLHEAADLADRMLTLFFDPGSGLAYDVGDDQESLIVRPRETYEGATPSGNSAAAEALTRLGRLTGEARLLDAADKLLVSVGPLLRSHPMGFGNWLSALELRQAPAHEVAIVGAVDDASTKAMLRSVHARYAPAQVLVGWDPAEPNTFASPLLADRGQIGGKATAYVCEGYVCSLPTTDAKQLAAQLMR